MFIPDYYCFHERLPFTVSYLVEVRNLKQYSIHFNFILVLGFRDFELDFIFNKQITIPFSA